MYFILFSLDFEFETDKRHYCSANQLKTNECIDVASSRFDAHCTSAKHEHSGANVRNTHSAKHNHFRIPLG
jgi:hypothetical protein